LAQDLPEIRFHRVEAALRFLGLPDDPQMQLDLAGEARIVTGSSFHFA
jgi:hypothetical protein